MSKLDPHYIPSPSTGVNPFLPLLPRRLTAIGGGKIIGNNKDLYCSCFELSVDVTKLKPPNPVFRKTVSMIGHNHLPPSLEVIKTDQN
jgi:hypothetical protein